MLFILLILPFAISEKCFSLTFDCGMTIEFNTRDNSVHFSLHVPQEIFHPWDWAGIGIKELADGTDMTNADLVSIIFKEDIIVDRWGLENGYPPDDVSLGGEESVDPGPVSADPQESKVFSWNRDFDTGDIYDIALEPNTTYYILWAYGPLDENGDLGMHNDMGYNEFTFIDCPDTTMETIMDTII